MVLVWVAAFGVSAAVTAEDPVEVRSRISRLPLLDLRGDLAPVRYSAGSLHRASQLQPAFELLADSFGGWSGNKQRIPVLLLNRDEWGQAGFGQPYGFASRLADASVALAAWGDQGTIELWNRLLSGALPTVEDAPLRSTADEASSLLGTDLLALFEAARILVEGAGYRGSQPWLSDLIAHTVAIPTISRMPGGGFQQAVRLYGRLGAPRSSGPLPLDGYAAGLSRSDWLWYQAQFFAGAHAILAEEGARKTGKSMVRLVKGSGGSISAAELVGKYPVLDRWLRESFAPATP